MIVNKKNLYLSLLIIAAFMLIYIVLYYCPTYIITKDKLTIEFIDTGKSDSIFIKFPNGKTALVDGGFANSLPKIQSTLYKYRVREIDYLIATHQHDDHIGSFYDILNIYDINGIYMPASPIENGKLVNLENEIEENNIPLYFSKHGDVLIDDSDIFLKVISPFPQDKYYEENDYSLVFYLTYKDSSFLFMGDATRKIEILLMKYYEEELKKADVIKLGHHGSDTSSSYNFLEKISPRYAVVTTDENGENKLSKNLLNKLNELKIKLFSTNKYGNISFISDGNDIKIITER